MSTVPGGFTPPQPATPEIQALCNKVKSQVETKTGTNYSNYVAESYISQVVAGTISIVKVHCGGKTYIHIKILEHLVGRNLPPELEGCQEHMSEGDPLVPF
ncbi:cystatin-A1-like [Lissotriton helveticus]